MLSWLQQWLRYSLNTVYDRPTFIKKLCFLNPWNINSIEWFNKTHPHKFQRSPVLFLLHSHLYNTVYIDQEYSDHKQLNVWAFRFLNQKTGLAMDIYMCVVDVYPRLEQKLLGRFSSNLPKTYNLKKNRCTKCFFYFKLRFIQKPQHFPKVIASVSEKQVFGSLWRHTLLHRGPRCTPPH